jgi:hypothetical protein
MGLCAKFTLAARVNLGEHVALFEMPAFLKSTCCNRPSTWASMSMENIARTVRRVATAT